MRRRIVGLVAAFSALGVGCSLVVDALGPYDSASSEGGAMVIEAGADAIQDASRDGSLDVSDAPVVRDSAPACIPDGASLLGDPNNCGACGNICCGASCVDGSCGPGIPRILEPNADNPVAIAIDPDGTAVYWSHFDADAGGSIVRYDRSSGALQPIATGLNYVNMMQVGTDRVFFSENGGQAPRVASVPKLGPPPGSVETIGQTLGIANGMALVGSRIWWTDTGYGGTPPNGSIHVADLDGGNPQPVYQLLEGPFGIAVSGTTLFWTEWGYGHDVQIGSMDGGAITTPSQGANDPDYIVISGATAYWGDFTSPTLWWLPPGGAPQQQQASSAPMGSGVGGIAVDPTGDYVYWVLNGPEGMLLATPTSMDAGSTLPPLVGLQPCPTQVAVDDQCIYLVNQGACGSQWDSVSEAGTGSVVRLEKPH